VDVSLSAIAWRPCYRIIASRFPPLSPFEKVADARDLAAIDLVEAMTNDRLREEAGELSFVPLGDRASGSGAPLIMAAFAHLNPGDDRFTDGSYGIFYADNTIETAVARTRYHRARFMAATNEPAQELDMRVCAVDLVADLHDIRRARGSRPELYHSTSYGASQVFAAELRAAGSNGIVYESLRFGGGECAAVFRPHLLSNCRQERHLCYVWDGRKFATVYEKREFGK
jgi:hypothetical protein